MPTNRIKKPSEKAQPLTHFVRIVRGILLKGNGLPGVSQEIWPMALFAVVAMFIAMKCYRQTLD
jgi:ABC-2 type transport system permease protein